MPVITNATINVVGAVVGPVTLTISNNGTTVTPTDLQTFTDVLTLLQAQIENPTQSEENIAILDTWVKNNPNYPTGPATIDTANADAAITSNDIGETSR